MNNSYMVLKQGDMWVIFNMATRVKHSQFKNYDYAVNTCMRLNGII